MTTQTTADSWRDHDDRDAHQARLADELAAEASQPDADW
jgi:hypothetical protein